MRQQQIDESNAGSGAVLADRICPGGSLQIPRVVGTSSGSGKPLLRTSSTPSDSSRALKQSTRVPCRIQYDPQSVLNSRSWRCVKKSYASLRIHRKGPIYNCCQFFFFFFFFFLPVLLTTCSMET